MIPDPIKPAQIHALTDRTEARRLTSERVQKFIEDPSAYDRGTFVDLDDAPSVAARYCSGTEDFTAVKHIGGGALRVDTAKIELYRSPEVAKNGRVLFADFLREVDPSECFNVKLLEFYLENPKLYPVEWIRFTEHNTTYVLFPNTRYVRTGSSEEWIRCLYWDDGRVYEDRLPVSEILTNAYVIAKRAPKK